MSMRRCWRLFVAGGRRGMLCQQASLDLTIESISVHRVSLGCYQHIVKRNLSHKIRTFNRSGGNIHLAVVSGGYVLGLINYDPLLWASKPKTPGEVSLLLDLAVPSDRYKH